MCQSSTSFSPHPTKCWLNFDWWWFEPVGFANRAQKCKDQLLIIFCVAFGEEKQQSVTPKNRLKQQTDFSDSPPDGNASPSGWVSNPNSVKKFRPGLTMAMWSNLLARASTRRQKSHRSCTNWCNPYAMQWQMIISLTDAKSLPLTSFIRSVKRLKENDCLLDKSLKEMVFVSN